MISGQGDDPGFSYFCKLDLLTMNEQMTPIHNVVVSHSVMM